MPSDSPTRVSYTCTGGETAFAYPFEWVFSADDIQVLRNGAVLALGTDYTLSTSTFPSGPGNVIPIFVPIAGDIVVINLSIPIERLVNYQNGNALSAQTLNTEANDIYAILRQISTFNDLLSPHYSESSNPIYPNDIILPILGPSEFWQKSSTGTSIIASSILPDPSAAQLAAELLSSDPVLGAHLVNTEKNVRVQEYIANVNCVTDEPTSAYQITLNDYGKTIGLENSGMTITLPPLASVPTGWWVNIFFYRVGPGGYVTVNVGAVGDPIEYSGSFKLIGSGRAHVFTKFVLGSVVAWFLPDNEVGLIGQIKNFAFDHPEGEYVLCDGRALSRTLYGSLWALMGATWGPGDGSTTFNIPDLRGRTLIGEGTGSGLTARTIGQIGGAETHALTGDENGPHTHPPLSGLNFNCETTTGPQALSVIGGSNFIHEPTTGSSGLGTPHNNMQPFAVLKPMIKVF